MKKVIYFIAAALMVVSFVSCSDMLDSKSDRYVYDPALDQKVDSMFYINGILKGVQQAIDQTVLTNELRGDLLSTSANASTDLRRLAAFDYADGNQYDSAYVYYRIINNCNYYVAHRDTTLATGSTQVAMKEYAEAKAIRAWAYMQLARTYGSVPFYTTPLTNIASVEEAAKLERKDMKGICDALAPDLEQYVNLPVPNWGNFDAGTSKTVATSKMMFPVRLVLGDLYLETGQYAKAAEHYFQYLKKAKAVCGNYVANLNNYPDYLNLSSDVINADTYANPNYNSWSSIFSFDNETQTYVAMATNKLRGQITQLPGLFGYNYYSASDGYTYNEMMSLQPSSAFLDLSNNQTYYYQTTNGQTTTVGSQVIGDMRYHAIKNQIPSAETTAAEPVYVIMKYQNANIQIYRTAGIYLKLAEAVNRMGHPDVAFAVLKDGWNSTLEKDTTYMTAEGIQFLKTTVPFLTDENEVIFNDEDHGLKYSLGNQGIHMRGCGYTAGNLSEYRLSTELEKRWSALRQKGYEIPTTAADTLKAKIDAVEDMLCDEMALELAFEGSRFGDLCRIARHKNNDNPYTANFGSLWLRDKLAFKKPALDLSDPNNWLMPFK